MTVDLSIGNCELLGLLARQKSVGFEFVHRDGHVLHATKSARAILFARDDFDPTGKTLQDIDGPDVGHERLDVVRQVCEQQVPKQYQQIRYGRLTTISLWPVRSGPETAPGEADAAITMMTHAHSSPQLSPNVNGVSPFASVTGQAAGDVVSSAFASWGPLSSLTPRERDALVWIGLGLSQKEIGERLSVSPKTVETHRMRLGKKLDVTTGAEIVRIAYRSGIGPEHTKLKTHSGAAWMVSHPSDRVTPQPESNHGQSAHLGDTNDAPATSL